MAADLNSHKTYSTTVGVTNEEDLHAMVALFTMDANELFEKWVFSSVIYDATEEEEAWLDNLELGLEFEEVG